MLIKVVHRSTQEAKNPLKACLRLKWIIPAAARFPDQWSKEPIPTIHNEGVPHPSDRVIAFDDLEVSYWLGMRREKNQWLEE